MSPPAPSLQLSVRHDSWIRQQVRDLVLHLEAPVESAELLQAALISLARAVVHFNWDVHARALRPESADAAFVAFAREQVKADMVDEVRQMTHLSRLQRRRWALVKLARETAQRRLQAQGRRREPSHEELSVLTGLSVTEIDALERMARLGPWQPGEGSQHLMELRSLKSVTPQQLRQAREDTRTMLHGLAALLVQCPPQRLRILQRHFGLMCHCEGRPLLQGDPLPAPGRLQRLMGWVKAAGLDRRSRASMTTPTDLEEVWPQRLGQLLHQAMKGSVGVPEAVIG